MVLFLSAVLGSLAAVAALNWLVNPWALYPPRLVMPRVADGRAAKCFLPRQVQRPPEQLVLGSSKMMRFEPRRLEERTGLRTFNAAVAGASVADYVPFYRFATEEVHAPIRRVLIGIEWQSFSGLERSDDALSASAD